MTTLRLIGHAVMMLTVTLTSVFVTSNSHAGDDVALFCWCIRVGDVANDENDVGKFSTMCKDIATQKGYPRVHVRSPRTGEVFPNFALDPDVGAPKGFTQCGPYIDGKAICLNQSVPPLPDEPYGCFGAGL